MKTSGLNTHFQQEHTGTFRRYDDTHPLDLSAGFDLDGRRLLMLVTVIAPTELPEPGVIDQREP